MRENRMEYEANIFASQASLPDDTILEYIENGYDIQQIARAMCSDINLIALKVDTLIAQGYQLRKQEHQNDFLKYSRVIHRFVYDICEFCCKRDTQVIHILPTETSG